MARFAGLFPGFLTRLVFGGGQPAPAPQMAATWSDALTWNDTAPWSDAA